jgi:hypothetical protein
MTTSSFDEAALAFDDDTDVAPEARVVWVGNESGFDRRLPADRALLPQLGAFWAQDTPERDLIFADQRCGGYSAVRRTECPVMLHRQMPDFVGGEPKLMKTNFMRGVLSLPFDPNVVSR